jgi:arylsulfatase A-like enzyme
MASTLVARLAAAPLKPPNIVFILCDDLGYGDLGCYGSKIPTPNLDRMAAAGVRFTNFSSADPVCSPSRAALLTGRYPTRVGVPHVFFPQDKGGMNLDEVTLANVLKNRGYRTICTGKWHLGRPVEYLPTSRGFDEYFGIPYRRPKDASTTRSRALSFTTSNPTRTKATTSRRRIRKSSPKYSAESTRCCRVSPGKSRNHGPRLRSAAPIPLYPPGRILDRIFDRVVAPKLAQWEQGSHTVRAL